MAKIYTKTGDEGMTTLVGGCRVRKDCTRLEAYGTVDELSSMLGWLRVALADETTEKALVRIQNVLFEVGALLAAQDEETARRLGDVSDEELRLMEEQMDRWTAQLPPWRGFVLPGGTEAAARAQMCRTVCRRAERRIFALAQDSYVPQNVQKFVNRLSDYLFLLALYVNNLQGKEEILWQKSR